MNSSGEWTYTVRWCHNNEWHEQTVDSYKTGRALVDSLSTPIWELHAIRNDIAEQLKDINNV